MNIRSTKRKSSVPAPKLPGLMLGVENPSPQLAAKAQSVLGLQRPPESLLIGLPARAVRSDAFDNALRSSCLSLTRMLSMELTRNAHPTLKTGVRVFWLGLKVNRLFEKWQAEDRDLPALLIESAGTALGSASLASALTGVGTSFFSDESWQDQIGVALTAAGAVAQEEDIALALMKDKVASSEIGKVLPLVNPFIEYALSEDEAHEGVCFKPMGDLEAI